MKMIGINATLYLFIITLYDFTLCKKDFILCNEV